MNQNRGWYFEVIKVLAVVSLLLYLASRCILLAYSHIGREHKKMREEIQRLGEKNARLEDELKISRSRFESMKGYRDSISEDYSAQSATLTTMTDRAVIAECRLAENKIQLENEIETVAKMTIYSGLYKCSKEFLLNKLKDYDNCKADLGRYKRVAEDCKVDAERYKSDAMRYKRGFQVYKQKALDTEADCSANVFDFHTQKTALEEEVKALKAKGQEGRLEDDDVKKIKGMERVIEDLKMEVKNLKDSQETTTAAYEMEIRGDKATIKDLQTELSDSQEELDAYKHDNEERSQEIQELLEVRKQHVKEVAALNQELALAQLALTAKSRLDGDDESSPSNPPSGGNSSGAGPPGPSVLPSASGTAQTPGSLSNFFGNSTLPPMDPNPQCPQQ